VSQLNKVRGSIRAKSSNYLNKDFQITESASDKSSHILQPHICQWRIQKIFSGGATMDRVKLPLLSKNY
jgi:hypothetical protein